MLAVGGAATSGTKDRERESGFNLAAREQAGARQETAKASGRVEAWFGDTTWRGCTVQAAALGERARWTSGSVGSFGCPDPVLKRLRKRLSPALALATHESGGLLRLRAKQPAAAPAKQNSVQQSLLLERKLALPGIGLCLHSSARVLRRTASANDSDHYQLPIVRI